MRRLLLALLALAAAVPAAAQSVPVRRPPAAVRAAALSGGEVAEFGHFVLTLGTHAAVVGVAIVLNEGAFGDGEDAGVVVYPVLLGPAVTGGVACAAGRAFGLPGSCGSALLWSYAGAVPGLVLMGVGALTSEDEGWVAYLAILAGGGLYAIVPPLAALEGYRRGARMAPGLSLVPSPDGGRTPVAALNVRF